MYATLFGFLASFDDPSEVQSNSLEDKREAHLTVRDEVLQQSKGGF